MLRMAAWIDTLKPELDQDQGLEVEPPPLTGALDTGNLWEALPGPGKREEGEREKGEWREREGKGGRGSVSEVGLIRDRGDMTDSFKLRSTL